MNTRTPFVGLLALLWLIGCEPEGKIGSAPQHPAPTPVNRSAPSVLDDPSSPRSNRDVLADAPMFDVSGEPDGTRNFYFVLDGSDSMNRGCSGATKIDQLKRAVEQFMGNVPKDANIGALVFDITGVREVVELGPNNHDRFLKAVRAMRAEHGTPLGQTIALGAQKLHAQYKKQQGYGEYRLIVVTDGEASDNLDDGLRVADRLGIPIYTIGFCIPGGHSLATASASYADANSEAELKVALSKTVAELDVFDPTVFDEKIMDRVMN